MTKPKKEKVDLEGLSDEDFLSLPLETQEKYLQQLPEDHRFRALKRTFDSIKAVHRGATFADPAFQENLQHLDSWLSTNFERIRTFLPEEHRPYFDQQRGLQIVDLGGAKLRAGGFHKTFYLSTEEGDLIPYAFLGTPTTQLEKDIPRASNEDQASKMGESARFVLMKYKALQRITSAVDGRPVGLAKANKRECFNKALLKSCRRAGSFNAPTVKRAIKQFPGDGFRFNANEDALYLGAVDKRNKNHFKWSYVKSTILPKLEALSKL